MPTSHFDTFLDEALEAWQYTRQGVIEEAETVPADRFDFRPAPESRTVAELVLHIVEAGQMMAGELSRPDADFTRQPFQDHLREHVGTLPASPSKDELLALLRETGESGQARLRALGEEGIVKGIRRFDGVEGTRLAWLYHGVDHESYHRGQLALYVRILGEVPALTRRILGG
jgi:uncharacterized damage-inducible protein DinB